MSSTLFDDVSPKSIYRYLGSSVIIILGIGTVFYRFVEGFSWIDAYYFSVVTLATVGYGDLAPRTTAGKLFTIFTFLSELEYWPRSLAFLCASERSRE